MAALPVPRGPGRRAVLSALALAAAGTPLAITQPWSHAAAKPAQPQPGGLLWHPTPGKDGLKAFAGIEADRGHLHPDRAGTYVVVEQDHWRFNISTDDRDPTGGGNDRQRTEVKGMVEAGKEVKMHNNETWQIAYEMFIPASLHGTSRFTHIFQAKTAATNGGPWVTVSLSRNAKGEQIRFQADSTSGRPVITTTDLDPLRERWLRVTLTMRIGPNGSAGMTLSSAPNGQAAAKVLAEGTRENITIPDQGDAVRPKWGIYRSIKSDPSDILDTFLLLRKFTATRTG